MKWFSFRNVTALTVVSALVVCANLGAKEVTDGGVVVAMPDCNGKELKTAKRCKDPFDICQRFDSSPPGGGQTWECPSQYDDSQLVNPGCERIQYDAPYTIHCDSNGTTMCTQRRICIKKGTGSGTHCEAGGAAGPPQLTTFYFSADPCWWIWALDPVRGTPVTGGHSL